MRRRSSRGRPGRNLRIGLGLVIAALAVWWTQAPDFHSTGEPDIARSTQQPAAPQDSAAQTSPSPAVLRVGASPAGKYTLNGVVSKVADGDTVTMTVSGKSHRIRLDSIDAPEIGHSETEPGQPYAEASQRYLEGLVGGKRITAQCYEKDQYNRELCALVLPDGDSVNRLMVANGFAWAYTARRGEYLRDTALRSLQEQAREAGRGLWAQGGPTEPWKWRYDCWRNQRCEHP
ncbi:thermonuclease family protein [Bordetella sp. 15P40C-2]|uniref:thermonuclease family protein n=1 Tax=Bordetella sp. 15P40C-2 TaxID=2572246 RepID=UPI001F3E45AF|nr:thermonuclease family protein [Bordetella sp. 15P40C-2]